MGTAGLYEVLEWARKEGDVRAVDRIAIKVLADAIQEGVFFKRVTPDTQCSSSLLQKVRHAASDVVGRTCPY